MFKVILLFALLCFTSHAEPEIAIIPVKELKKIMPSVSYQMIHKPTKLQFKRFPIASSKSSTWEAPTLPATFVLRIPKGRIFSTAGYVLIDGKYLVSDLLWAWSPYKKDIKSFSLKKAAPLKRISGKVVVLSQEGHQNYYHWMFEILPKLALLKNVGSYDWIYLPRMTLPFQKQTLGMMGVDLNKVIEADPDTYIEADEVIVPSFVSRSCYTPPWVAEYLRDSLLKTVNLAEHKDKFSPLVFISRQKASYRRINNEDELYAYLEPLGFKRYALEDLSASDQIILFSHAKVIISAHGAGLANILFCQPGTKVLELFQALEDDTYCYLSQVLSLDYQCLKTTDFQKRAKGERKDTFVPLQLFKNFVRENGVSLP